MLSYFYSHHQFGFSVPVLAANNKVHHARCPKTWVLYIQQLSISAATHQA